MVVVDDSIVRGTTSRKIVQDDPGRRRARGAPAHLELAADHAGPATTASTRRSRQELIASSHSPDEIARYVTADSLGYLSVEGLAQAVGDPAWKSYCNACFTGNYLTPLESPQAAPATG